jgi:hypothetical protein
MTGRRPLQWETIAKSKISRASFGRAPRRPTFSDRERRNLSGHVRFNIAFAPDWKTPTYHAPDIEPSAVADSSADLRRSRVPGL